MSNILFANNARTILSSAINNSTTILPVASTTGFPTISGGDYFYVTLDDGSNIEIVKVTSTTSNTFTVVRAQDGTSAHSFAATTTRVENRLNAEVISGFVPKTGATMTGTLTLNGNAVGNLDAVPLQQLTSVTNNYLLKSGGTMTGTLTLNGNAVGNLDAVPLQQLNTYAPLNSPGFAGVPTAPTATSGTSTTQLATTAFVHDAVNAITSVSWGGSPPYVIRIGPIKLIWGTISIQNNTIATFTYPDGGFSTAALQVIVSLGPGGPYNISNSHFIESYPSVNASGPASCDIRLHSIGDENGGTEFVDITVFAIGY